MVINDDNYKKPYLPYKFKLILRGSRDGFTPNKFHELCDGKSNTVTFIKVNGTEEILGGYNPLEWKTTGKWCKTNDSFIFSFKNRNIKDAILSNVINTNYALNYSSLCGPQFGLDLVVYSSKLNGRTNFDVTYCKWNYYKKRIRDNGNNFSIEDYEIFKIIRRQM
ncbi:hypothetical protein C1646_674002 [Rhizophagus diaphanus]|nr:hypothetical protein C1646_674002 [Rhizophagus diaphanus] [Rhizophagus sp. MUCL 43196]